MPDNQVDEIKNRLDIVEIIRGYMKLEKGGVNFRGLCPFHREKTPSFFVSPTRQLWRCFGCSEGGDMFSFVMQIEGVEFKDALKTLADRAGVRLRSYDPKIRSEKSRLYEVCEKACQFFEKQLTSSSLGEEAKAYLCDRGINQESILKFRLGFAPDTRSGLTTFLRNQGYSPNEIFKAGLCIQGAPSVHYPTSSDYDRFRGRIMFPIFDLNSQVIGFGGRIFFGKSQVPNSKLAKYINSPQTILYDKSKLLYGLHAAKMKIREQDSCILVEGYTDVIMAHKAGCENTISTSGTALTESQLDIIRRYTNNLTTSFDMDIAGDNATKKGIGIAQQKGFNIKVITLPDGKDPAEVIQKSERKWKKSIENPSSIGDFYFSSALSRYDKSTPEGIKNISEILLPQIIQIPSQIERSYWVQKLASEFSCREDVIWNDLKRLPVNEGGQIPTRRSEPNKLKENQDTKKTKREALYERLLAATLKDSKCLELVRKKDLELFDKNSTAISILLKLKNYMTSEKPSSPLAVLNEDSLVNLRILSDEEKKFVGELFFQEEIFPIFDDNVNIQDEFILCVKSVKQILLREKLTKLQQDLKKQDSDGEVLKEFQKISIELANL